MTKLRDWAVAAFLGMVSPAFAGNVPYLPSSPPPDPSNILPNLNQVIGNVNSGTGGLLYSVQNVATGTGTSEQTLGAYTMPAATLANGQAIRVRCFGTTGATANNKTHTIYFGSESYATSTEAANAQSWIQEALVTRTVVSSALTWEVSFLSISGTASATLKSSVTTGTDADTGIVIKCTGTDGTSAANDIVLGSMTVEAVR